MLTGRQHAMALVLSFPSLLRIDDLLNCLAAQQNEPSQLQLLASAHTVDTTSHWNDLAAYIVSIKDESIPMYLPFPKRAHSGSSGNGSSDGFLLAASNST